ncbi:MAG: SagB/ThcOx family dehydrogenase [Coxiellaceae bacterium]|nr:SagB/ThcOx family dehydrogenase [Coxiellaceae bacterium]
MTNKKSSLTGNLVNAAIWGNSYQCKITSMTSGFTTHAAHHDQKNIKTRIAEDFLLRSRCRRDDDEARSSVDMYLEDAGVAMVSLSGNDDVDATNAIDLPSSAPLDGSLSGALHNRRSTRTFSQGSIDLASFAVIVRAAAGVTDHLSVSLDDGEARAIIHTRTVASAGSTYPISLYCYVNNVDGLAPGIYKYHSVRDQLSVFADEVTGRQLLNTYGKSSDSESISNASVIFLLTAQPWRSMRKYGCRGMRYLLHECGAISQNIHLVSAALQLGSIDCGGFFENEVNDVLHFDGNFQTFLHAVIVGRC